MANVNTNQVISDAREELKARVRQRGENDKRIAELRILLRTLVRFMPEEAHRQAVLKEVETAKRKAPSLAEAVADVLMQNKGAMTSSQIRETLEQGGFDLEEYSQPLGAIMTALSRLVEQKKLKRTFTSSKAVAYTWIGLAEPK